MIPHFILCIVLIPFVGLFSDKKEVDLNSFVLLFDIDTADSLETEISLHKNGNDDPDLIVKWTIINGDITAKWRITNYSKIFMDGNKNIYIANIDKKYEGKYCIQYFQKRDVVEIVISENLMKEIMPLLSTCIYNPVIITIHVIEIVAVVAVAFIFHKYACCQCKKNACCQCKKNAFCQCEKKTENKQGKETIPLLDISQQQEKQFVSDADKPNLSLKWRFSGRTHDNSRKCWLLDLVLNPDDDLIVTDGENNELKKFSLEGTLKSKLSFKTRPDSLALTDGYLAMVTFPHETVLRVIDTRDALSLVSTIPFRSQCAGIGSMNDGRLIICNRESKSVIVSSKDGEILQEIKIGSSGETLFRKPSYVRVVDSRTIYVSDYRRKEFFIININHDNKYTINKHQISYPRTSCVVDGMLLVASSNIRLFTLDGNEAGEVTLSGVHHVRGLAFSESKRLLAITHKNDGGDEVISVYKVMKH